MSSPLPKLHQINAAAETLGVSRWTIYKLVREGKLVRIQIGENSSRITDESLRKLIGIKAVGEAEEAARLVARQADPFNVAAKRRTADQCKKREKQRAEIERIDYALAKHVADMERSGLTILTSYGALRIDAEDAPRVVQVVRAVLKQQLKRTEVSRG